MFGDQLANEVSNPKCSSSLELGFQIYQIRVLKGKDSSGCFS